MGTLAPIRRLAQNVDRWRYQRHGQPPLVRVLGLQIYVPATVLDPVAFRTGILLAESVRKSKPARVLDLGCGSGIVGLVAARSGSKVVAADLNPRAVAAARINAMLNQVAVEVRQGDLFASLTGERFDLIAFNPPFFGGPAPEALRMALADTPELPTFARFLREFPDYLNPGGCALIAGSTTGALGQMRLLYQQLGRQYSPFAWRERISERLVIDRVCP